MRSCLMQWQKRGKKERRVHKESLSPRLIALQAQQAQLRSAQARHRRKNAAARSLRTQRAEAVMRSPRARSFSLDMRKSAQPRI